MVIRVQVWSDNLDGAMKDLKFKIMDEKLPNSVRNRMYFERPCARRVRRQNRLAFDAAQRRVLASVVNSILRRGRG